MRHIELSSKETSLWNEMTEEAESLRSFKRALGMLIWKDCQTDVAVVCPDKKILWSLLDQGENILMTQTFLGKTSVIFYPKVMVRNGLWLNHPG